MADIQQPAEQKTDRKFRLSYLLIVKHFTFILFLVLLAVVYIANGHWADKQVRAINKTSNELKELRYEYLTLKSELMFKGKLSEIVKVTAPLGLKEITGPPMVLGDSSSYK
jgi:hypothetical protein